MSLSRNPPKAAAQTKHISNFHWRNAANRERQTRRRRRRQTVADQLSLSVISVYLKGTSPRAEVPRGHAPFSRHYTTTGQLARAALDGRQNRMMRGTLVRHIAVLMARPIWVACRLTPR